MEMHSKKSEPSFWDKMLRFVRASGSSEKRKTENSLETTAQATFTETIPPEQKQLSKKVKPITSSYPALESPSRQPTAMRKKVEPAHFQRQEVESNSSEKITKTMLLPCGVWVPVPNQNQSSKKPTKPLANEPQKPRSKDAPKSPLKDLPKSILKGQTNVLLPFKEPSRTDLLRSQQDEYVSVGTSYAHHHGQHVKPRSATSQLAQIPNVSEKMRKTTSLANEPSKARSNPDNSLTTTKTIPSEPKQVSKNIKPVTSSYPVSESPSRQPTATRKKVEPAHFQRQEVKSNSMEKSTKTMLLSCGHLVPVLNQNESLKKPRTDLLRSQQDEYVSVGTLYAHHHGQHVDPRSATSQAKIPNVSEEMRKTTKPPFIGILPEQNNASKELSTATRFSDVSRQVKENPKRNNKASANGNGPPRKPSTTPDRAPKKKKTLGLGSTSSSASKWFKGTLRPVRSPSPKAYFIKPTENLPEGYNQRKDVYLNSMNISRYLLPLHTGDELEFILGDRDKEKPMARKVRIARYCNRSYEVLKEYLEEFLDLMESKDRNQVLVETLPCLALWELLGSMSSETEAECKLYIKTLLDLLSKLLDFYILDKTLVEDVIVTVLQEELFQENSWPGLPRMITMCRPSTNGRPLFEGAIRFCYDVASKVPRAVSALLPTISALSESKHFKSKTFLFDLLQKIISSSNSYLPSMKVWNEMPLVPTINELTGPLIEEDQHLSPLKTTEPYDGPEEYMDTYFRLLRAETFAAIQRGIKELKASKLDPRDMNVYFDVTLAGYEVHYGRFSLALQFKPAKPVKKWEASPQLMFGNLICLSPNRRFDDLIWATVSNRDPKLLASSQIILVELIDYNSKSTSEIMYALQVYSGSTVMVESPTYFHSLKPILDSLRQFNMEEFPLRDEILKATPHPNVPDYIDFQGTFDTSGICVASSMKRKGTALENYNIFGTMNVHEFSNRLAKSSTTTLEPSQRSAMLHALKNRLAIIQGPPGCGKTFLGVKIVQLLLSMTPKLTKPILLLTYKNHALDEFLKAMLEFCSKDDVVRIGGRSKEPELEECNLQAVMKNNKVAKVQFVEMQETRSEIEEIASQIKAMSTCVDGTFYLTRESLLGELSDKQVTSLLVEAGWKTTAPAFRVNSKYADKGWISNLLADIEKYFGSTKSFLLQCLQTGVPQAHKEAQYCYDLFCQALRLWLPDKHELSKLKAFQANFIQEDYSVEELVENPSQGKKKGKPKPGDGDDYYDEEEVAEMLESRLSSSGGEGRRKTDNLLIFDSLKKKSSEILIKFSDFPSNTESRSTILSVQNLWSLGEIERLKFLHSLLRERSSNTTAEFDELLKELEKLKNRKQELEVHQKVDVLLSKKIVGVTITGASINHDLLHHIGPSIVIVEEAAEILEPSLLAALTPNIEHLILIGDHQQLKPQVDTYKLTTQYDFNVSLMERLIRTGFPYKSLKKQNRMRPEFAALLQDIYPDLENNYERIADNTALTCISKSMFFWSHNDPEKEDRTFTNDKEADRVVALVLFLLKNGYKASDITVLTAYLGQAKLLRQKLKDKPKLSGGHNSDPTSDGDSVQVQTIDMFQGDENKYVIVSLVRSNKDGNIGFLKDINRRCVAQSRAKCGMYFIGNVDTLQRKETCWKTLIQQMNKEGCVGRAIPLQCWKHKHLSKYPATDAQEILDVVSNSLKMCSRKCGDQLPCNIAGHVCDKPCSPRHSHPNCFNLVEDTFPACGHKVTRKCFEKLCNLRCEEKVAVRLKCGHTMEKKCYQKTEDLLCKTMVDYEFPGCRHPSPKKKKCSEQIAWKCCHEVYFKADCGHDVAKKCHERNEDVKCTVTPCARQRDCGHPCTNMCGDDCNKGDCKTCKEIHEEKLKQFHENAQKHAEELKAKIKRGEKAFSREEIHKRDATTAEYQKVEDQVMKFIQPMHNWSPSITKIERVTNLELEKKFEEAKSRAFGDHIDTKFHGTSEEGVKGITENGFRMPDQNPPSNKRGMYGQGIYFATDSSKSAQDIYTKGSCMLLLCQVILGKTNVVNRSDNTLNKKRLRKEKYDSVMAPRGTDVQNDEFVIFDPDQALPQYIIHFSTYTGYRSPSQLLKSSQVTPPTGQPFFKKNVSASRNIDPTDPFENDYRLAACHFLSHRRSQTINIQSVDVVINQGLESKFEAKKQDFKSRGIPDGEILAYHGTKKSSIDSILKTNLDWVRYASGQAYGRGNYFSEFPDISIPYGDGLLLCRVLPGKEYVNSGRGNIPPGYNSKKVLLGSHGQAGGGLLAGSNVSGEMVIIEDADQILPYFEMHLK